MLKGVNGLISPELLKILATMGHGDEIVLADGNFPVTRFCEQQFARADGIGTVEMLNAVLTLIPLDYAVDYSAVVVKNKDSDDPEIWVRYEKVLAEYADGAKGFVVLTKDEFYERAKGAYCVVYTGEMARFANIIIRKGTIKR